jgi:hypothetical protein
MAERIMKDQDIERSAAEAIVNSALGFLQLCACFPEQAFSPSKLVGVAWRAFILYTRDYAAFCEKVAGRFIHHEPGDMPDQAKDATTVHHTIQFMKSHHVLFNTVLWFHARGETSGCYQGSVCSDHSV